MSTAIVGWPRIVSMGLAGFAVAAIGSSAFKGPGLQTEIIAQPLAYQLPKYPGGTSLRLAMVHDVLLDRYLRHGRAWYEKRIAESREMIAARMKGAATGPEFDETLFGAMDDLAVGLEQLHQSEAAAEVMREKLKVMPGLVMPHWEENERSRGAWELTREQYHHYTARANLGTSMVHGAVPRALAGEAAAVGEVRRGLGYLEEAIRINPAAHFGRERWQAVVGQHLAACAGDPGLLTRYDVVGNKWEDVEVRRRSLYGRGLRKPARELDRELSMEERESMRRMTQPVVMDAEWMEAVKPSIQDAAPFDEPALAIVGMWTLGGGANPHFALALAHIAHQVGQLEIAWDGYERAVELEGRFSKDAGAREALVAHCRAKQAEIAHAEVPGGAGDWEAATRKRHQEELAWAQRYQGEYEAWEEGQIRKGVALGSPEFYTGFLAGRAPIASPVGRADEIEVRIFAPNGLLDGMPAGLVGGGLLALIAALTAKRTPSIG